jgi:hypothetical protein
MLSLVPVVLGARAPVGELVAVLCAAQHRSICCCHVEALVGAGLTDSRSRGPAGMRECQGKGKSPIAWRLLDDGSHQPTAVGQPVAT